MSREKMRKGHVSPSEGSHDLYFHEGVFGQVAYRYGAAGREGCSEELGIDLVHRRKVSDVAQEHCRLDDVAEVCTGLAEYGLRVQE